MHKFWRDVDHKLRVLQHADITDFILILGETDWPAPMRWSAFSLNA